MSNTLRLAIDLINRRSITPTDAGCQHLIARRLQPLGFTATHLRFGEVDNLWLRYGYKAPLFVFAGHTDVVPPGPLTEWNSDPFCATVTDGYLYGRGAADMKSNIASMISATETFITSYPDINGSIGFLITSDEEGASINGTRKVIEYLEKNNTQIQWCIVGEPSSEQRLADVIKIGRRGSLNAILTIKGAQGHVAYPHIADNPVHKASHFLAEITTIEWDIGNQHFPPTGFQISNIQAGHGVENVIPGELRLMFNFRFSTEQTDIGLKKRVQQLLNKHELDYEIKWTLSGLPFLTKKGQLLDASIHAIKDICRIDTKRSTGGGTSDGRFIAPTGAEVIELGVINKTIHKVNECVKISDMMVLTDIYQSILKKLLLT